jgi:hypothetical protein
MSCPCFGAEFPYEKNGTDGVLVDATHQEPQVRMRVAQVEYSGGRRQKGDERRPLKAASQSVERWHTHTYTHFFDGSLSIQSRDVTGQSEILAWHDIAEHVLLLRNFLLM